MLIYALLCASSIHIDFTLCYVNMAYTYAYTCIYTHLLTSTNVIIKSRKHREAGVGCCVNMPRTDLRPLSHSFVCAINHATTEGRTGGRKTTTPLPSYCYSTTRQQLFTLLTMTMLYFVYNIFSSCFIFVRHVHDQKPNESVNYRGRTF